MSGDAQLPPLRFFIFTCRDTRTDFRRPLAEALRQGHETWYIWLRRRPRVWRAGGAGPAVEEGEEMSFPALLELLRQVTRQDRLNVYFNSTNTSFPLIMPALKLVCGKGIWCLDMHDDLLYDQVGWRRMRAAIAVKLQVWAANVVVRAAESLSELFPHSVPFGNASQVRPLARDHFDYDKVLVLASLDSRFDFGLMEAAARELPEITFDLHGQVSRDDARVRQEVDALCRYANVHYHGAYGLAELSGILSRYAVSFAPYRTNTRLTRYLDPLRFYHCLNSGMELITTRIPQAENLSRALHIIETPAELAKVLGALKTGEGARRNSPQNYTQQSWNDRAARLIDLVRRYAEPQEAIISSEPLRARSQS